MSLRYICCQPALPYYLWQCEIVINNFIECGIRPENINIVCSTKDNEVPDEWRKLQAHYSDVKFYFYEDEREDRSYIPSIYFHLMKKHIVNCGNDPLFIHDSDIVFTKPVNFEEMGRGDKWYMSDTVSYIHYDYIMSKSDVIYSKMCNIIGLDPLIPKLMASNSGGAQYIVKNTNYEFWDKVEKDSVKLYNMFLEEEPNYTKKHDGDYPIQKWTAGMWSFLWNAWLFGHETCVDQRLDFCWATNSTEDWEKNSIYHNAGATTSADGLFYKGEWINELPYNKNLTIKEGASKKYYEIIQKIEKTSPLIKEKVVNDHFVSPSLGGRLGNNMFMIANAYAQALDQNKQFVVPKRQINIDQYENNIFRKVDFLIDNPNEDSYSGYFQSEKYFSKYSEAIKSLFSPTPEFIGKALLTYPFIGNKVACIHVRRGDYLNYPTIHPVVSIEYIKKAYSQLPETPYCLVFSDDKEWCEQNIDIPNAIFVNLPPHESMWLMSLCNYFVLSNSSFSWWGAYLSRSKDKSVISPRSWFGSEGPDNWDDIYCNDWRIMETYIENGKIMPK